MGLLSRDSWPPAREVHVGLLWHPWVYREDVGIAIVESAPIELDRLRTGIAASAVGAIVSFEGRVRDHDGGEGVVGLRYEAHPSAGSVLAELVSTTEQRPEVTAVAAAHRLGNLAIGELAFVVMVAAPHRMEAFAACQWLVDEAKQRLPIWKLQTFTDGRSEWVNCL